MLTRQGGPRKPVLCAFERETSWTFKGEKLLQTRLSLRREYILSGNLSEAPNEFSLTVSGLPRVAMLTR